MKGKYSPAEFIVTQKYRIEGEPDLKHVFRCFAKRSNLPVQMHKQYFTRLTDAFSKKFEPMSTWQQF